MYVLHLLVVSATSHKEAVKLCLKQTDTIPSDISDYSTILASMDENGIQVVEDGREHQEIFKDREAVEKLNEYIIEKWIKATPFKDEILSKKLKEISEGKKMDGYSYYECKKYLGRLQQRVDVGDTSKFNVLESRYAAEEYNENGVTQLESEYDKLPQSVKFIREVKKYIVFVNFNF